MSFQEGFEAIEKVKSSTLRLSDTVTRVEALEVRLATLRETQDGIATLATQLTDNLSILQNAAKGLSGQKVAFEEFAATLPTLVETVLADAEARIEEQQDDMARLVRELPTILETVVERKLSALMSQLETNLSARLQDELRDTRATMREAIEVSASRNEARIDAARKDIITNMPRTIFGRRGAKV